MEKNVISKVSAVLGKEAMQAPACWIFQAQAVSVCQKNMWNALQYSWNVCYSSSQSM